MELSIASFAYPQHDRESRAELARRLTTSTGPREGLVLSTCLRVELALPGPVGHLEEALSDMFGDLADVPAPRTLSGERAAEHLFRIVAGLESPILGELEILTQYRQALLEAEAASEVRGVFARLLESAIAAGRQARDLLPGSPHNSMAAVAAQAVGSSSEVAVLGSGIMATAVVDGLLQLPAPPRVTVVARHPEKVADRPGVEVLSFTHAPKVLGESSAVISATSAKHRLIDDRVVADAVRERSSPLLLIDMAMPPDFARPSQGDVTYLDIDDLARMADRRSRSDEADALIRNLASEAYRRFRDHDQVGPLMTGLVNVADRLSNETFDRFAGRLESSEDQDVLRQAIHTTARKLLAGPMSYLNGGDRSTEAVDVIADAFGVDDE